MGAMLTYLEGAIKRPGGQKWALTAHQLLSAAGRQPLWIGLVVLALAARWLPGPRTIDDAFITYRYARNILAGNGFVYNPGEQVLGTTTPLYTILLALLGALAGGTQAPFPLLALAINSLADAVTCLLLFHLGRRLGAPRAGLGAALVWAVAPFSVTFAIGGLETSLYVLLLTATVVCYLDRRYRLSALLAALSLLTRPDALILLGPLALDRAWRSIRKGNTILPEALLFGLPLILWFGFATAYFGSPIPHSITAKSLAYHLPGEAAFVRLLQHYATPFMDHRTFGLPAIATGLVLYPFLFLAGARRFLAVEPRLWPFLAYPWLYFAAFALANPLIFRWYLTPPLPAYILGILIGAESLIGAIGARPIPPIPPSLQGKGGEDLDPGDLAATGLPVPSPEQDPGKDRVELTLQNREIPPPLSPLLSPVRGEKGPGDERGRLWLGLASILFLLLAPFALSLREWTLQPGHGLQRPAPEMAWYELELLYRQAAETVVPRLGSSPRERVLAAGDVGVLGFYTGARILDTVGLNSPQAVGYYPLDRALYTINYAVPPDLILDQKPDFVVILEVYGREGLLKEPDFWQAYRLFRKIPTSMYGSDGMLILERRK